MMRGTRMCVLVPACYALAWLTGVCVIASTKLTPIRSTLSPCAGMGYALNNAAAKNLKFKI